MNLVRWDPFRELEDMGERLNRVFAGLGRPGLVRSSGNEGREELTVPQWAPMVDIVETDDEYLIKAELPEVRREDVKVSVENGVLTIRGERKLEKEANGKKLHRVERYYGSFLRTFVVPDNVDETKVRAEFKDGVLNVHLPKSEKAKPRAIEVKVA
jgi:HSP20 family protein